MSRQIAWILFCGSLAAAGVLALNEWNGFFNAAEHTSDVLRNLGGPFASDTLVQHPALQYLIHTILAYTGSWLTFRVRPAAWQSLLLVGMLMLLFMLPGTLALFGILFEPISGAAALLVGVLLSQLAGTISGESRRAQLTQAFQGRLSPARLQTVMEKAPSDLFLPAERECSLIACRIVNLDALEEMLDGPRLTELMEKFHRELYSRLLDLGALTDLLSEGSVLGTFGLPESGDSPAPAACRAALELGRWAKDFAAEVASTAQSRPQVGIAVVTGHAVAGLWGEEKTPIYHLIGSIVEHSMDLAGLNAEYGSLLLIDGRTLQLAQESIEVRPLDLVHSGRGRATEEVYELLGVRGEVPGEILRRRDEFWQGMLFFREGKLEEAQRAFDRAELGGQTTDPVLDHFRTRALANPTDSSEAPPTPTVTGEEPPASGMVPTGNMGNTVTPVVPASLGIVGIKHTTRVLIAKS